MRIKFTEAAVETIIPRCFNGDTMEAANLLASTVVDCLENIMTNDDHATPVCHKVDKQKCHREGEKRCLKKYREAGRES